MIKKITFVGVGLLMISSPFLASAQTTTTSSNTSLIAALTALVQQLEQELQQLIAAKSSTPAVSASSPQSVASGMTTDVALACNAATGLKRGDTDATTGGKVSQLQKMLGINPATGYYGAQTATGYNNICGGLGNSQPTSVAGMSKYTDSNFGFSFWYPSSQSVKVVGTAQNSIQQYGSGTQILKTVSAPGFSIDEVYSTNGQILGDESDDPSPLSSVFYYFFSSSNGAWMEYTDGGPKGGPAGTIPADVSKNTMGGLHIFGGYTRFGIKDIIPLSAHNFLVLTATCNDATDYSCDFGSTNSGSGYNKFKTAEQTILATDSSVAIPVSTAQQIAAIQAEANAYGVQSGGSSSQSSALQAYTNSQYGFSVQYPSTIAITPCQHAGDWSPPQVCQGTPLVVFDNSIGIFASTNPQTVANCNAGQLGKAPIAVTINNIPFTKSSEGDFAAGTEHEVVAYSTIKAGTCYSITGDFSGATIGFNDTQFLGELTSIVQGFQFTQ